MNHFESSLNKVNHSFQPNCDFANFEHPRFGRIPAIVMLEDTEADSELLAYYKYALDDCPQWYSDLWSQT